MMVARLFWIASGLLAALILYHGIQLVRALEQRPARLTLPGLPASGESPLVRAKEYADYAVIAERNIFKPPASQVPPEKVTPIVTSPVVEPKVVTPAPAVPSFKLIGTLLRENEKAAVLVIDGGEQKSFHIGDTLVQGTRLVEVFKDKVVLEREGERVELALKIEEKEKAPARAGRPLTGPREPGGRGLPPMPGPEAAPPGPAEEAGPEMPGVPMPGVPMPGLPRGAGPAPLPVREQARVAPVPLAEGGVALRIFSIRRGSIFATAGLTNGDLVLSVDGREVRTAVEFYQLFEGLTASGPMAIKVRRGNREESLQVAPR